MAMSVLWCRGSQHRLQGTGVAIVAWFAPYLQCDACLRVPVQAALHDIQQVPVGQLRVCDAVLGVADGMHLGHEGQVCKGRPAGTPAPQPASTRRPTKQHGTLLAASIY